MKRSRIFLGMSTFLLATVGITLAKTHRMEQVTTFYYTKTTSAGHACTLVVLTMCTKEGCCGQCIFNGHVLYSQGGGSVANHDAVRCDQTVAYNPD